MAHLCSVCAYADWVFATSISQGYIFRKMASGDRISTKNEPMVWVTVFLHMPPSPSDCLSAAFPFFLSSFRQQSISWRCSATIFLMLELIQSLMAHILFVVEAANGCQCNSVGLFVASVSGGAG